MGSTPKTRVLYLIDLNIENLYFSLMLLEHFHQFWYLAKDLNPGWKMDFMGSFKNTPMPVSPARDPSWPQVEVSTNAFLVFFP